MGVPRLSLAVGPGASSPLDRMASSALLSDAPEAMRERLHVMEGFADFTLGEFVVDRESCLKAMRGFPGVGPRFAGEVAAVLDAFVADLGGRFPEAVAPVVADAGEAAVARLAERLRSYCATSPLPQPVTRVAVQLGVSVRQLDVASRRLGPAQSVHGGYVCDVSDAQRRVRRIHEAAVSLGRPAFDARSVAVAYRRQCDERALAGADERACARADARLSAVVSGVLSRAKHLFTRLYGDVFVLVGDSGRRPYRPTQPIRFESSGRWIDRHPGSRLEERICEVLRKSGPMRVTELSKAVGILESGFTHAAFNRVVANPCLLWKPLPDVVGVHGRSVPEFPQVDDLERLQRPADVLAYALNARAGDVATFPRWTPSTELCMLVWAAVSLRGGRLYQSLLAVSDPDSWPRVRGAPAWRREREEVGRWSIDLADLEPSGSRDPDWCDVHRALCHLDCFGRIGIVTCNRVMGLPLTSCSGVVLLALLCAMQAAVPGETPFDGAAASARVAKMRLALDSGLALRGAHYGGGDLPRWFGRGRSGWVEHATLASIPRIPGLIG